MKIDDFLNLTYEELESFTGIKQTAWSKYFNRKRTISEHNLVKICKALDMSMSDFWLALEIRRERTYKRNKKY